MRDLECRVPPVLLFGIVVLAMVLGGGSGEGWPELALLLTVVGCVFGFGGVLRFRQHGTTVSPTRPAQASVLVTTGLYRLSRNPMYLGLLCWTMALACYLGGLDRAPGAVGLARPFSNRAGRAGPAGSLR
ncbi:hypothetical protein LMBIIBHN_01613 [Aeromonas salmonicida]